MIPGIVLLVIGYLNPWVHEKKSQIKTTFISFIENSLFFRTRSELKDNENFHEDSYKILFVIDKECYCTHKFCKINSLQT